MEEEEEEMQRRAFREYMMRGGSGSTSNSTPITGREMKTVAATAGSPGLKTPTPTTTTSTTYDSSRKGSNNNNRSLALLLQGQKKKFYSLWQAFQRCARDWVQTDDQLQQVTLSIANLRQRCWVTSRALQQLLLQQEKQQQQQQQQQHFSPNLNPTTSWRNHGYRAPPKHHDGLLWSSSSSSSSMLSLPEPMLQLTLDDELVQHEKMLVLLRQLMSQVAQEQDALGRRLEDLLLFYHDPHPTPPCGASSNYSRSTSSDSNNDGEMEEENFTLIMAEKVEECLQLFAALARELYRKQALSQELFDSTGDALLYGYTDGWEDNNSSTMTLSADATATTKLPRRAAEKCAKEWPRNCSQSELREFSALLDEWVLSLASSQR